MTMKPETNSFTARYAGWCPKCHTAIEEGDSVCYDEEKNLVHEACVEEDDE